MVHLCRGRELGFRNALTGNAKECTKHKILQTCDNINGCEDKFYDGVYSLGTCHYVIRGSREENYIESWPHITGRSIHMIYMFNIVKKYKDIYIEIRSCLDGKLQMTIDAKKIIPKLSVPLEDEE